jgi:hypothetical protein
MSEPNPSLHIDSDWKRQAQEEKRRLAEQDKAKAEAPSAGPAAPTGGGPAAGTTTSGAATPSTEAGQAAARGAAARDPRGVRQVPPASFATLVQSLVTQALFYLGDLSPRGGEPVLNLDLAKHQIDMLSVLEEKTANNLSPDEKRLLDAALYESRMRYISVASQFIS